MRYRQIKSLEFDWATNNGFAKKKCCFFEKQHLFNYRLICIHMCMIEQTPSTDRKEHYKKKNNRTYMYINTRNKHIVHKKDIL